MTAVTQALDDFISRSLQNSPNDYFQSEADHEWRSPCELEIVDGQSLWRPVSMDKPLNFAGLANAVDAPIHADIQMYFSSFWSGSLQGQSNEGSLSLIQLWNQADFQRLIENLVGHLFMKNQTKQPFTVFFATTEEDSELFLSIDNETGKILLEEPGKPPLREVEANITAFLARLEPDLTPPVIY